MIKIEQILCRSDNIGLLLHDPNSADSVAVDAPDGAALLRALRAGGRHLRAVLITHHHTDHTEGIAALKQATGAEIIAPRGIAADTEAQEGRALDIGAFRFAPLATPGHTLDSLSYYMPQEHILFSGDTLFSLGCGRIFEGDAAMMHRSLQKLAALPPQTQIYCGHEYSAANARFALTVEPHNAALARRAAEITALRAQGKLTLPATLAQELAANPFLRCDSAELRAALGCPAAMGDADVFARLRQMKDRF